MTKEELINRFPGKEVLGKLCWTPATAARAIGMHRNTTLAWCRRTKARQLDMPLITPPMPRARDFIPIDEFLEWIGYEGQN